MNPHRLPAGHAPEAHLQPLYIDPEVIVNGHHATTDELDLILLGFALITEATLDGDLCSPCGRIVLDRIGVRPGIVEATMRVVAASASELGMTALIGMHERYDFFNPEHRKSAFCDLADYWVLVVIKMRTCGRECPTCARLGPSWSADIGNH